MRPPASPAELSLHRMLQEIRGFQPLSPAMVEAFERVPRHRFIGRVYRQGRGEPLLVDPDCDDEALLAEVYRDSAIAVQVRGRLATSTSSQPSLMAEMIRLAGVRPGMRVLEIGTATGWNAALLAYLVGNDGRVVSVEVDAALARSAEETLAREGFGDRVRVIHGDGTNGAADEAPYDAILVTVACPDITRAWRGQLAEGASLVLPFELPDGAAPLLQLERRGQRLAGRQVSWTWFVGLRGASVPGWPEPLEADGDPDLRRLLAQEPTEHRLPSHVAADSALGLWWLAHRPDEPPAVLALRDADLRRRRRLALWRRPDSLAVLDAMRWLGYGHPAMLDTAAALTDAWRAAGEPLLSGWAVTVVDADDEVSGPALRRGQSTLIVGG